jgi:hypothetical protein
MLVSQYTNFKADSILGLKNQVDILNTLQSVFDITILETTDKYCKWDYQDGSGNHYELKSRRTYKNTYLTTLLPCHKIMKTPVKQVFLFKFTDKLCYIEYNEAVFNTFKKGLITDTRNNKEDLHYYIPISRLIDIA